MANIERQIAEYVAAHAEEMVAFLQDLIRIRSVWGEIPQLSQAAELVGVRLERARASVSYPDSGTAGAPNMLAHAGQGQTDRTLLFCGHLDVYPPSRAWSMDPFAGVVHDGRVYGAGAADMKGGTAAMTMAACVLAALDEPRNGRMSVLAVPNHFEGGEGTRRALRAGLMAEAGVVCEPTDLDLCAAQRGILYANVVVKGVAAHTVAARIGVNAIEKAATVIDGLTSRDFVRPDVDAYGAQKIVNTAMIAGGIKHNLIPEECRLTVDIRFAPSTTTDDVLSEVKALLADIGKRDPRFEAIVDPEETCIRNPRSPMPWVEHPIRDTLAAAHQQVLGRAPIVSCHPAWPDAPVLKEHGIPAVTYGPGSKLCYWDDEYVPIDEYLHAIRVYALTACRWFSEPRDP